MKFGAIYQKHGGYDILEYIIRYTIYTNQV